MPNVNQLADDLLDIQFRANPVWPALLGVPTDHTGLGDASEEEEAQTASAVRAVLERANAVDAASLEAEERNTLDVIKELATNHLASADSRAAEFTITDLFIGPAAGLLTALPMLSVAEPEQQDAYLARLNAVGDYLSKTLARHRAGVEAGRVGVKHLVEAAIAHIDRYLSEPETDPLLQPSPPEGAEAFDAERRRILAEVVHPAFAGYRDGLRELLEHARPPEQVGLCWLPDGEQLYATAARTHTTTDRTPRELHQTGLELIDKLADEYAEIGRRAFGTGNLETIFARLREDESLRWSDADELLDSARAAIERAAVKAPEFFGTIPSAPCVVEPVPESAAPGAPAAYYMQPATDGSRPGTYFANTYHAEERFKHTSEVIAFHEAIPGHHFQISLAQDLTNVPMLRRVSGFNAYIEGWGLYTERLADEMGLYSDDIALLGMLTVDSMRAGRLVVDTGLHALGWSREQAVEYLKANTPMPLIEINAEVDRYIAYPGQALSYMVGRLEILRLRSAAQEALGEAFDIKAFHDVVLGSGAVPIGVMESMVMDWVRSVQ